MKLKKLCLIALPLMALIILGTLWLTRAGRDNREEIIITMPYNENIREADTNYYKLWLEDKTGLAIKFNIVQDPQSADYLRSMFESGYVKSDAFFSILAGEDYYEWNAVIQEFGAKGYILPLNDYIDESVHMNKVLAEFSDYDLREAMTSPDGNIYYMPGFDPSIAESHFQVMWLNRGWLNKMGLPAPQTTEDFRAVLEAFRDGDPNGNGLRDEIPLAGSNDVASEQIYNFIINAFVYNDPDNSRLYIEDGAARFAPVTDEWREAMKYLSGLYADGLIDPFSYDHRVVTGLANDAWNMLGGFASRSVTDVIFQSNPERIVDFVHIAPLIGPDGAQNATVRTPLPHPAGVITSACENPEAVFKLFDLMMSEEAFLIGRYGEENADWIHANPTEIDFFGDSAAVRVLHQLRNGVQNKHLCEAGPFFAYPKYADKVTFTGFEIDHEYIDARAYFTYAPYEPSEYLRTFHRGSAAEAVRTAVDAYTNESIRQFITGEKDPYDDTAWAAHLQKYQELGVQSLIDAVMEEMP